MNLHESHESKLQFFTYRIYPNSKLPILSAHVSGVTVSPRAASGLPPDARCCSDTASWWPLTQEPSVDQCRPAREDVPAAAPGDSDLDSGRLTDSPVSEDRTDSSEKTDMTRSGEW